MKTYLVTVQKMMFEGDKAWQTGTYKIFANSEEEARAIVNNSLGLREEPGFRITEVREVEH